jgi:hypothetical protein
MEEVGALLAQGVEVSADGADGLSAREGAKAAGDLLLDLFHHMHPFLSKILRASSSELAQRIAEDMTEFFRTNPSIPIQRVVNIAAETIKRDLHGQTNRVVPVARTILVVLFVMVQLILFGIIGYAAYKDLKVTT